MKFTIPAYGEFKPWQQQVSVAWTGSCVQWIYDDGANRRIVLPTSGSLLVKDSTDATTLVTFSGTTAGIVDVAGASGIYRVNGTKVIGAREPAPPADATDLATAIALVNNLKQIIRNHGLAN